MSVKTRDVHRQSLETSTELSEYSIPHFIAPLEIFRVLNAANVPFMLVGTHASGGWTRNPRTTTEVDVLIARRLHKRAVNVLLAAFPQLRAEDREDETQLRYAETAQILIDVMKANQDLYRVAFRHAHPVKWKGQTYRIPSLELALAMKFLAMISVSRNYADKYFDAADFMGMVQSNAGIDSRKLHALGQLVYNGGGDDIVEKVRQVRAGEKFVL